MLTRPGNLDDLTVLVEAHQSVPSDARTSLGDELRRHVKARIGVSVRVEVVEPHTLEWSLGKAKRISDRRA